MVLGYLKPMVEVGFVPIYITESRIINRHKVYGERCIEDKCFLMLLEKFIVIRLIIECSKSFCFSG